MGVGLIVGGEVMRGQLGHRVRQIRKLSWSGKGSLHGHAKRQRGDNETRGMDLSTFHVVRFHGIHQKESEPSSSSSRFHVVVASSVSLVSVDPASRCVSPMMMNNQSVVVGHLVTTSLWAMWHLGCVCVCGNRREISWLTFIVDAGDGCSLPFVVVAVSRIADLPRIWCRVRLCAGETRAPSSLCWHSSPSVSGGDAWPLWR